VLPIRNILFPVDFSRRSREVWPDVLEMAGLLSANVRVLHVIQAGEDPDAVAPYLESALERRKQDLTELFRVSSGAAKAIYDVQVGNPADSIVAEAANLEAPLIMLPTRGQTRFRQLLLGSVTAAVLHDADCPVWTEAHRDPAPQHRRPPRSLVCAVDMGPHTPEILRGARELQSLVDCRLHIVHSVPGIDPRFRSGVASRAHELLVANAAEAFPGLCQQAGLQAELQIVEDPDLTGGIVEAAEQHQADLLLIGRGVMQGPLGRLRSNAHELIRRSPCPVVSL
jgi:nucleotide-binding universal stress UspA family protein